MNGTDWQAAACAEKQRFASRREAGRVLARQVHRSDRVGRTRKPVEVFRCVCCGGFHIGGVDVPAARVRQWAKW